MLEDEHRVFAEGLLTAQSAGGAVAVPFLVSLELDDGSISRLACYLDRRLLPNP